MKNIGFLLFIVTFSGIISGQSFSKTETERWQQQAKNVTLIRDNYGIPHIYGKSDADAVFGLMYAQCEDDFPRVEMNYIEKLGRMAELTGENDLFDDLIIKLIIDTGAAKEDYQKSPDWLKKLCMAFADAVNFYIYKHPDKKPALLFRFEPWYPLLWTDGSIGAIDLAGIKASEVQKFYSGEKDLSFRPSSVPIDPSIVRFKQKPENDETLTGSNGFAFAPKITESGNAILYINPHVTFYFRPEVHMVSEEGLNAYGAVTWGQFFVYQGFNEHCGWMHTSSRSDAADAYAEKVSKKGKRYVYQYERRQRPVSEKLITLKYKKGNEILSKTVTGLYTHHGPVMANRDGKWLSLRADNRLLNGLIQCWQRTKAKNLADYKKTLELNGNISNNTVYADADGNIAYWHGNRMPRRDIKFDWSKPVDGSIKATEWKGLHTLDETFHIYNPENGWLQNCNSTPFTAAGNNSPLKKNYPAYMAPDGENFRGINAVRVLNETKVYNMEKVIRAGYDTRLAAFEVLVPALVKIFEKDIAVTDSLYAWLIGPVSVLKNWDYRSSEQSIATTLAIEWGQRLQPLILETKMIDDDEADIVDKTKVFAQNATADDLLPALVATIRDLQKRFGSWQLPWGEINRFQRIAADINNKFDDSKPSIPVGYASSAWGMLPSYTSRTYPGTNKRYGVNGNSFVAVVEFGKKIKAKSLLAGGESGDPLSPHFFDQSVMYSKGQFKDVLFYKEDVMKHAEREYHPGE